MSAHSHTHGHPHCVVLGRAQVIPAGFGGYNTEYAVAMLGELLGPPPRVPTALMATVWFGANDAALRSKGHGWVHVPIDRYEDNLITIIRTLKRYARHVLVFTPPRVDEPGRLQFQRVKYGADGATGVLERTDAEAAR